MLPITFPCRTPNNKNILVTQISLHIITDSRSPSLILVFTLERFVCEQLFFSFGFVLRSEEDPKKVGFALRKIHKFKITSIISFLTRLHFLDCAESRRRELSSPRRNSEVELLTPVADKGENIYACECVLIFLEIRGKKLQLCVNLKGKHDKQSRKVPLHRQHKVCSARLNLSPMIHSQLIFMRHIVVIKISCYA